MEYIIYSYEEFVDDFLVSVYSKNWYQRYKYPKQIQPDKHFKIPQKYPCKIVTQEVDSTLYNDGDYGGIWEGFCCKISN